MYRALVSTLQPVVFTDSVNADVGGVDVTCKEFVRAGRSRPEVVDMVLGAGIGSPGERKAWIAAVPAKVVPTYVFFLRTRLSMRIYSQHDLHR